MQDEIERKLWLINEISNIKNNFHYRDNIYEHLCRKCRIFGEDMLELLGNKNILDTRDVDKRIYCLSTDIEGIRKFLGKAKNDTLYRLNDKGCLINITKEDIISICDEMIDNLANSIVDLKSPKTEKE